LTSQQIAKLKKELKNYLKNKNILDIFLIGSMFKDKFDPNDIDIIVLFRERKTEENNDLIYEIKKSIKFENIHIEPLIIDDIKKNKVFSTILYEGYSISNNKSFSETLGYKSFSLFIFSLEKLNKIKKVQFAQAIYGRKNNGLLKQEGGIQLGKGSFITPVNKEELFKEILNKFNVSFSIKKSLINY
jgi:predicted nucleotidyltransferase